MKAGALLALALTLSACSSSQRAPLSARYQATADAGRSQALAFVRAQPTAREIVARKPRGAWVVLADLESSWAQRRPDYCAHEYEVFYEPPAASPMVWWVDARVHRVTRPTEDAFGADWRTAKGLNTASPFADDLDAEIARIDNAPDPDPQLNRCLDGLPPTLFTPKRP